MTDEARARICPRCGKEIPAGSAECPRCETRWAVLLHSRETVLTGCALIVVILFVVTGTVVRTYHGKLQALAGQWFSAAETDLKAGNTKAALADLRNALVYEPEDPRIQFRLTQALMAAGRDEEARSYLEGLLARSPSDAEVNLGLARIAAKAGNESEAMRYYHGAIYGVWVKDAVANRLNARLELSRFLIAEKDPPSADSELIALEAEIPQRNGAMLHEETGELFLRAGDANRALGEFRRALEESHAPAEAWSGAGLAAYRMGDYRVAGRYLERAAREEKKDAAVAEALGTTRLILAWSPEEPRLRDAERHERVRHDLAQAISRAESCAQSSGMDLPKTASLFNGSNQEKELPALYAQAKNLQAGLSDRYLARHPEELDAAINVIFELEAAATQRCGAPTGLDEALEILGKSRQNGGQ